MPSFRIRYQVHNQRGETVVHVTEEIITASNSAEARRIVEARFYGMKVTFLGTSPA